MSSSCSKTFLKENGLFTTEEQKWGYLGVSDLPESNLNHQFGDMSGENSESPRMLHAQENKLTLKIHVNSVFEQKHLEDSSDHNLSTILNFSEPSIASSIVNVLHPL